MSHGAAGRLYAPSRQTGLPRFFGDMSGRGPSPFLKATTGWGTTPLRFPTRPLPSGASSAFHHRPPSGTCPTEPPPRTGDAMQKLNETIRRHLSIQGFACEVELVGQMAPWLRWTPALSAIWISAGTTARSP